MFRGIAAASADNSVIFPYEVFTTAFMQDAGEESQRIIHPFLERQPFGTFDQALDLDELERLRIPAAFVLSKDDIALPPGEFGWRRFPERLPEGSPLIYAPGSHESQFTQPEALAQALIQAADG